MGKPGADTTIGTAAEAGGAPPPPVVPGAGGGGAAAGFTPPAPPHAATATAHQCRGNSGHDGGDRPAHRA